MSELATFVFGIALFLLGMLVPMRYPNLPDWISNGGILFGIALIFVAVGIYIADLPASERFSRLGVPVWLVIVGVALFSVGVPWYVASNKSVQNNLALSIRPLKYDNKITFNSHSIVPNEENNKPFRLSVLNRSSDSLSDVSIKFEIKDLDVWNIIHDTEAFPIVEKTPKGLVMVVTKYNGGKTWAQIPMNTDGGVTIDLVPGGRPVEIEMPTSIKTAISLYAIANSHESKQPPDKSFVNKLVGANNHLERFDLLHNAQFESMVELPDVSAALTWKSSGKEQTRSFTFRSVYIPVIGPFWAKDETGEHPVHFLTAGMGILAFEDINKPDSGFYSAWKRWKESNVTR